LVNQAVNTVKSGFQPAQFYGHLLSKINQIQEVAMSNYANAKDVLPEELFQQIREHFPSGTLYVSDKQERDDRKQLIVNLAKQNMSAREIATLVGVSVRRVNHVLADRRKRKVEYVWNSNVPAA
jgi:hypothetical protein